MEKVRMAEPITTEMIWQADIRELTKAINRLAEALETAPKDTNGK